MTAAGWYNAQGDPPATLRYWDGAQWVGDAVADNASTATSTPGYEIVATPVSTTHDPSYGAYDIVARGQSVPTPVTHQAVGPPAELTFLPGLKVLAVIISVVKAIPVVVTALSLRWLSGLGRDLDRVLGSGNADFVRKSANTLYVVLAVMGALLVVQLIAAFNERALFLFVIAFVVTLLDVFSLVHQALNGSLFFILLTFVITAAQAGMTFWALTVYRNTA